MKDKICASVKNAMNVYKFIEGDIFPQTGMFNSIPNGDNLHTKKGEVTKYDTKRFIKRNFPYNTSDHEWNKEMAIKLLEDKDLVERMQNKNINKKDVVLMINDKEIFSGLVKEYQSKVFRFAFEYVADTLEYCGDNDYLAEKLCDNTCEILSKIGMSIKDQQQQAEINKKFINDIYDQIKY